MSLIFKGWALTFCSLFSSVLLRSFYSARFHTPLQGISTRCWDFISLLPWFRHRLPQVSFSQRSPYCLSLSLPFFLFLSLSFTFSMLSSILDHFLSIFIILMYMVIMHFCKFRLDLNIIDKDYNIFSNQYHQQKPKGSMAQSHISNVFSF